MVLVVIGLVVGVAAKAYLSEPLDPKRYGIGVARYEISSEFVDRDLVQIGLLPENATAEPPLLLLLHGRDSAPADTASNELFEALEDSGEDAPAVALVNGGPDSYFHDREDGAWGRYVVEEALPQAIEELGADPERVAIGGISMGGFGALDLVRLYPGRFCALGAHSAAVFEDFADAPIGAFDDEEDFEEHDLLELIPESEGAFDLPTWLDVGESDPFLETNRALEEVLNEAGNDVALQESPGDHDDSYWERNMGDYISFYARSLRSCPAPAEASSRDARVGSDA
jgi:S-formylglutathione hydrolase FrmB